MFTKSHNALQFYCKLNFQLVSTPQNFNFLEEVHVVMEKSHQGSCNFYFLKNENFKEKKGDFLVTSEENQAQLQ